MLAIQTRIVHKGLILLSVPLMFEVVAATTLVYLQDSYSQAVKAEALRTEVLYRIKQLWRWNITLTTNSLGASLMKSTIPSRLNEALFSRQYKGLAGLLASDPQQMRLLEEIAAAHQEQRVLSANIKSSLSGRSSQVQQILALSKNLNTWEKLIAKDIQVSNLIRTLKDHELQKSAKAIERVRLLASLIQLVLAGLIVGSAVIAYVLFRYFMQGMYKGVQALMLNIKRFKEGETLAPALAGSDELALLDMRFHEMSDAVASAQKMKQAFFNTVSNELSVPIRSTRDRLTRLSTGALGALSEEAVKGANKAKVSLDRLITLLNDLLALQAPGSTCMEISPSACSLKQVIHASIDAVSAHAERNGVRLKAENTETTAFADPDRIVQVLVNLLSNAVKFSPSGAGVVVSTVVLGDQVEVRVKDSGRGVPAHLQEAIFERFKQVSSSDATEKGGTGLGLPICNQIVELHGGKIGVDSEEGTGSTFWFRLPVSRPDQAQQRAHPVQPPDATPKRKLHRLIPKTIYAKGLVLISVPLIVELAFGTSLLSLQRFYEDKLNKERAAVEVLFRTNEMWIICAEFVLLQAQYILFDGPKEPIDDKVERYHAEDRALQRLVAYDKNQQRDLDLIRFRSHKLLELCNRLEPVSLKGGLSFAKLRMLNFDLGIFTRARTNVFRMQGSIERLGQPQFLKRDATIAEVNNASARVNSLVAGSLAVSAIVAILLFVYFIRTINSGLQVMVDNTERFKKGEELKPLSAGGDELAQLAIAFHEMANEIKQAQSAKQAIVSTISHDLRSPLTSVSGYFSLLSAGGFGATSPEVTAVAEQCERNVDQLIRLISDLLDLDKIEAGMLALQPKMLGVDEVMEKAISQVTPFAAESAVTISGGETTAKIYADPDRIVQALVNLLSSAVKLSQGGSRIDASAVQRNGSVEIRVTSSNAKTCSDSLSTQFDRYQKRELGLRLELPLSKEIVRLHGGTIGVTAEQLGCTLWFCVPSAEPSRLTA